MSALGDDLIRAMGEAVAHIEGKDVPGLVVHIPAEIDVAAIRQTIGLSRAGFGETDAGRVTRFRLNEPIQKFPSSCPPSGRVRFAW